MYSVYSFYEFSNLENISQLKKEITDFQAGEDVLGTILISLEGINGTISGPQASLDHFIQSIRTLPNISIPTIKVSADGAHAFKRFKVKIKKEIVTLGKGQLEVHKNTGTLVEPEQWNALIKDPNVILIDIRNDYECKIGQFAGAINPNTRSFRDFPDVVEGDLKLDKNKKVAIYCTGGIRCEKASTYMLKMGFEEVYQLSGGILNYLENTSPEESLWQGECFVFDERVSVDASLSKGKYDMCHACRSPIDEEEKISEFYLKGVSCSYCYHLTSDDRKSRFAERQKQFELIKQRNE